MTDFPVLEPPGAMLAVRTGQYLGPRGIISNPGTYTPSVGRMFLIPFWLPRQARFDRIGCGVATAVSTSKLRVGIYTSSGDWPAALILDAGQLDCASTGWKEITIDQSLGPGLVWLAGATQTANPSLRCLTDARSNGPYMFHLGVQNTGWADTTSFFYAIALDGQTGALTSDASSAAWVVGTNVQASLPRILLRVA